MSKPLSSSMPESYYSFEACDSNCLMLSMLDLLLPHHDVTDRLGVSEVCFLGPDENTGKCLFACVCMHLLSQQWIYIHVLVSVVDACLQWKQLQQSLSAFCCEGTGGLVDWAAERAKERGAWFWKAFTTGKAPSRGGIPHDVYGMTTASVETYVQGVLLGLRPLSMHVRKLPFIISRGFRV